MTYSLRTPLEGLSFFQWLIWPLVFAQPWALKLWVRRHYGRGVPYRIWISPFGKVRLIRMPMDAAISYAAPGSILPEARAFTLGLPRPEFISACVPKDSPRPPAPEGMIRIPMMPALTGVCRLDTS